MESSVQSATHVLVPTDFSVPADYALNYALAWARKLGASVTLLHVIQPVPLAGVDMGQAVPPPYLKDVEAEVTRHMEERLHRVTAAGVAGTMLVVYGVPYHEIVTAARLRHVDLIVMGTQGRSGFLYLLLGSVAENVVRLAPCAVLVARAPQT